MSEQERAGSLPTIEQLRERLGDIVDSVWPVAYQSGREAAALDIEAETRRPVELSEGVIVDLPLTTLNALRWAARIARGGDHG